MQRIDPALCRIALTRTALLAALIGLSGCMIPYPSHKVYEGNEITARSLLWLHAGMTARVQVVEKLGAPDIDFVEQRTIAYAWSGQSGGVFVFVPVPAAGEPIPIKMRRTLIIRFDADNKVAAFSIISRQAESIPYDVQVLSFDAKYDDWRVILDQWLAKHSRDPGLSGTGSK